VDVIPSREMEGKKRTNAKRRKEKKKQERRKKQQRWRGAPRRAERERDDVKGWHKWASNEPYVAAN